MSVIHTLLEGKRHTHNKTHVSRGPRGIIFGTECCASFPLFGLVVGPVVVAVAEGHRPSPFHHRPVLVTVVQHEFHGKQGNNVHHCDCCLV